MHRPNPWDDLATVVAVREAVGDGITILVDANQNHKVEGYETWSLGTSLKIAEELEKLDVYFMEEPRPRLDLARLTAIADSVDMLIAGGEHSPTIYDFREHLVKGAYDIVQPDITKVGGISEARRIGWTAQANGIRLIPHGWNTAVGLAADLQLASALPDTDLVKYLIDSPYIDELTADGWELDEDGMLAISDGPGLGIELDKDAVAKYTGEDAFLSVIQ